MCETMCMEVGCVIFLYIYRLEIQFWKHFEEHWMLTKIIQRNFGICKFMTKFNNVKSNIFIIEDILTVRFHNKSFRASNLELRKRKRLKFICVKHILCIVSIFYTDLLNFSEKRWLQQKSWKLQWIMFSIILLNTPKIEL